MEAYKLGKVIEKQMIIVQLILHQLQEERDVVKESLKRSKDIAIQKNDT